MQEKHKKTGITGFLILLFLLLGILAFFPQKAYADTTKHDVSFTISDASSTLLDKKSNLYTINKGIVRAVCSISHILISNTVQCFMCF